MTHPALDAHLLNRFQNNSPLFQNIPGVFNIKTHKVFHTCFRCWNGCLHKHGKKLKIMKSAKHGLRYPKQNTGNMPKWIYVAFFSRGKPSRPFNLNFWFQNCWPEFCWGIEIHFCADGSWLWPCCWMASFLLDMKSFATISVHVE